MPRPRSSPRFVAIVVMSVVVAAACGSGPSGADLASTDGGSTVATPRSPSPSPETAGRSTTPSTSSGSSATPTSSSTAAPESTATPGPFSLTSPAFDEGGPIPKAKTCDGAGGSPPLAWTDVPAGAGALVLVVDDLDAGDFVHWLVIDLPADATGSLRGNIAAGTSSPQQGRNDFGRVGWGGPCPPSGTHHYRFTLSAVAEPLGLGGHPDGPTVRAALRDATVIGRARLTGTYHR